MVAVFVVATFILSYWLTARCSGTKAQAAEALQPSRRAGSAGWSSL